MGQLRRLFVYGTLISASDTVAARRLSARSGNRMPGSIPGRLVAIPTPRGWFPALIPAPGSRVRGICCAVTLRPRDLAWLDRYEGREYRRVTGRALVGGARVTVQFYRWRGALPRGARRVPNGDFLDWLGRNRLRAYGSAARR